MLNKNTVSIVTVCFSLVSMGVQAGGFMSLTNNLGAGKTRWLSHMGSPKVIVITGGYELNLDLILSSPGGKIAALELNNPKTLGRSRLIRDPKSAEFKSCLDLGADKQLCFVADDLSGVSDDESNLKIEYKSLNKTVTKNFIVEWDEGQAPIAAYQDNGRDLEQVKALELKMPKSKEGEVSLVTVLSSSRKEKKSLTSNSAMDPLDP